MSAILFVAQSSTRGGVVTMLGHILSNWPETDARKLVLAHNTAHGGKSYFQSLAGDRVEVREIPIWDHMAVLAKPEGFTPWRSMLTKLINRLAQPWLFIRSVAYFRCICREMNVVVLFSHNGGYPGGTLNRAAILGARFAGVSQICHIVHNLARLPSRWLLPLAWLHDLAVFGADTKLIAVSEACADVLRANRFAPENILVIYNGISVTPPPESAGYAFPPEVAYIGELAERKGIPILLEAIATISSPVQLVLYGKGEPGYEAYLRDLCRKFGIEKRVGFRGFDPDAANKIAESAMLVLPSVAYESFGMVLLEAMRQKRPVIATDVGGMKEIVVHGETGFIVPASNVEALAGAITTILGDAGLAKSFGEAGYRRLCEKFSAEKMVSTYYSLTI